MGVSGDPVTFETARLLVRAWNPSDQSIEDDLKALLTPVVLAHLPPQLQVVASPNQWISARAAESDVLLAFQKGDQTLLGLVLLARIESEIHLGYLLTESVWGQGYATELVQGLIPELAKSGAHRVVGGVGHDNPASARVLKKAGFHKEACASTDDTEQYVWHISDSD